jgi:hypothetical protein
VPLSILRASPALWDVGLSVLALIQSPELEKRVLKRFATAYAPTPKARRVEQPWLLCDALPGPCVEYAGEVGAAEAHALAAWHTEYSTPDALVSFSSSRAERFAEV